MTVLIDNYDSFTFNLYQLIRSLGEPCRVVRNDEMTIEEIAQLRPDRLVISPGPGRPEDSGITLAAIAHFANQVPILGVCLGHQAIALAFGGRVSRAARAVHGKTSRVHHDSRGLFHALGGPIMATRYHSLVVERDHLPACLSVSAQTSDGTIMAIRHRTLPIEGVQFHPESIASEGGAAMISAFLNMQMPQVVPAGLLVRGA